MYVCIFIVRSSTYANHTQICPFDGHQWQTIPPVISSFLPSFPSQLTLNMSIHKPSRLFMRLNNPAWDLSSNSILLPLSPSISLYLSLSIPPSLVRSCPPSHLSCDVYGPFCFCVLMTTVTESYPLPMRPDERCYPDALLTPLCPWPQRRCLASQLRPVKNEDRGDLGELDWGPVRHPADRMLVPPPLPFSSSSSQWKYGAGQRWRWRWCCH